MTMNETTRLNDTQLDADVSVLGDDRGGEPKVSRVGGATAPEAAGGVREQLASPDAQPEGNAAQDDLERQKAMADARRDVASRLPKS